MRFEDHPFRSFTKAISYRFFGTIATMLVVYAVTREWKMSLGAGVLDAVSKIALFYIHERVWNRVRWGKRDVTPAVFWFTGLSGAGKTTLARRLAHDLNESGYSVEFLDGDVIRNFFQDRGFSKEERLRHLKSMSFIAAKLESKGAFVVASFITPYEETRRDNRENFTNYVEVYVKTSLAVCESRDTKGLYKKARSGEIKNFTGISDPFEEPTQPDLVIDTVDESEDQTYARLIASLKMRYPQLRALKAGN